jgi:hypothetical protein
MAPHKGTFGRIIKEYALTGVALVLMAIPAWDVLEKRGITTASMFFVIAWLIGAVLLAYSVYTNLRDVKRERNLRTLLVTIKDEHRTQIEVLSKRLSEEVASHTEELRALHEKHKRDVRDHRKIVIHSAWWGIGGIRRMYSRDITGLFDHFFTRYREQGLELKASEEPFGDGGYPGEPKQLWVSFSCPCADKPTEHTFRYGEVIDLHARCPRH